MKKTIIIIAIIIAILLGVALGVGLFIVGKTHENLESQTSNIVKNTQENTNNVENDNFNHNELIVNIEETQNNDGSKSYNLGGVTFTYGNEWTLYSFDLAEQKYDALENKAENLILMCLESEELDTDSDYAQEDVRQEFYDSLNSAYEELSIKGNGSFELIKDNTYCAYSETSQESVNVKTYIILNAQENKYCICMAISETPFTTVQTEKIQTIINTVQF